MRSSEAIAQRRVSHREQGPGRPRWYRAFAYAGCFRRRGAREGQSDRATWLRLTTHIAADQSSVVSRSGVCFRLDAHLKRLRRIDDRLPRRAEIDRAGCERGPDNTQLDDDPYSVGVRVEGAERVVADGSTRSERADEAVTASGLITEPSRTPLGSAAVRLVTAVRITRR